MAPVYEHNSVWWQLLIFILYLPFKGGSCIYPVIFPYPTASVTENEPLEIACTHNVPVRRLKWITDTFNGISIKPDCTSVYPSSFFNHSIYEYSCVSNTTFIITILRASRQEHGQIWRCAVFGVSSVDWQTSSGTRIFVVVPVRSVSINITGSSVSVLENLSTMFKCTTSEERPRSTIMWYFTNRNSPIQGDIITPIDNETLSATESTINLIFSKADSNSTVHCTAINIDGGNTKESNKKRILVKYAQIEGPVIDGYSDNDDYRMIISDPQSLVCYVKGGYPDPTVTWDCYSGLTTDISGEGEVRKQVNWTAGHTNNGSCKCTSDQEVSGSMQVKLDIIVLYPPSSPLFYANLTHDVSGKLEEIKGRTVVVTCVTSSFPKPFSFEWSNPSGEISGISDTLVLSNVERKMEGAYECTAKNRMDPTVGESKTMAARSQFTLEVLYPPEKPSLYFRSNLLSNTLSVIEGENVTIECKSSGKPKILTYSWTGSTENRSTLIFENIQAGDRGIYVCNVHNSMNPTVGPVIIGLAESSVMINVMSAPTIPTILYSSSTIHNKLLPYPQLAVIEGTIFSLKCTGSTGNPDPNYSWQGLETGVSDRVIFTNISSSDKKKYICLATNMMNSTLGKTVKGANMKAVDIEVLYPPRFDRIGTKYLTEHQNLYLSCGAYSNPLPFSYVWTRSYDAVKQASQVFAIENIKRSETGLYTCNAKNMMDTTLEGRAIGIGSITVDVRVLYYPDINISQLNGTDIVEGAHSVILLCTANADPTNYTFEKWTHFTPDGSTVIQQYDAKEDMEGQISLKFKSVKIMDSGIYECSVTNGISDYRTGNLYASINISQVIKGRPVVTESHSDVTAASYTNVTLAVSYYSNDGTDPTVRWYKLENDTKQEINKTGSRVFFVNEAETVHVIYYGVTFFQPGNTSYLHIIDINRGDFLHYEAEISNSINTTVSRIWLRAQGAPETPNEFKIVHNSETSSAVTLTWISGFHGGADQTFHVQYNTSTVMWQDGAEVEGFRQKNRQFRATIDNLSSETQYFFRIYAENIYGKSTISTEIVTVKTGPDNAEHTSASSLNVGATVGAATAAVLTAVATTTAVFFLLRRYRNIRVNRDAQKRDAVIDCMNEHEYVKMNAPADVIVGKTASGRTDENMRSSASEYDVLDSETTNDHIYAGLKAEATTKPSREEMTKQRMNDNKKRMQMKDVIDNASEQNLGQQVAEPDVVYSNLMIRNA